MTKYFKFTAKLLTGVFISGVLTLLLVMFTPSIFSKALHLWIDLLPSFKYVETEITTKQELAKSFDLEVTQDDAELFNNLQSVLPKTKDKSSPFFRLLTVHAYPEHCNFTLIGLHKTIDIAWRIEGLRCKSKQQCELARAQQICPDKKKHK